MFILGNFFIGIAQVADMLLSIVYWLLLIRVLISWVNPDRNNAIVQFLYRTTEPILYQFRRLLPPMGIDFSPILAFVFIVFLKYFLVASLFDLGTRLK